MLCDMFLIPIFLSLNTPIEVIITDIPTIALIFAIGGLLAQLVLKKKKKKKKQKCMSKNEKSSQFVSISITVWFFSFIFLNNIQNKKKK